MGLSASVEEAERISDDGLVWWFLSLLLFHWLCPCCIAVELAKLTSDLLHILLQVLLRHGLCHQELMLLLLRHGPAWPCIEHGGPLGLLLSFKEVKWIIRVAEASGEWWSTVCSRRGERHLRPGDGLLPEEGGGVGCKVRAGVRREDRHVLLRRELTDIEWILRSVGVESLCRARLNWRFEWILARAELRSCRCFKFLLTRRHYSSLWRTAQAD